MENLVYFPTFEPLDKNWLKFALLYVESFNPIIPNSGLPNLSSEYQKIISDTDLITPFQPNYLQGERAAIKAIEFIERVKENRFGYGGLFGRANLIRTFTDGPKIFKIYEEKFTMYWRDFCEQNSFSNPVNGGVLVTKELAFIYMTFLAEEIADEEGKSIITDSNEFDNFLSFKRSIPFPVRNKNRFAQGVLSLAIPRNISEIDVDKIIRFRNENRALIKSFNRELNRSLENVSDGITEKEFIGSFNNVYSELNQEIISQGTGFATIPLGFYLLLTNAIATTPEYIKEIIGGLGFLLSGKGALDNRWKEITDRRRCRRYVTNLERLK